MNLLNRDSLPFAQAMLLLEQAKAGHLWVPRDVSGDYALVLTAAVDLCPPGKEWWVHVNTDNGTQTVWTLASRLNDIDSRAFIGQFCKSAGLIIACACDFRVCNPSTEFLFHGTAYHRHRDAEDARRAQWFADRTKMPVEFWAGFCADGDDHEFGPQEALEWGVVQEVAGG